MQQVGFYSLSHFCVLLGRQFQFDFPHRAQYTARPFSRKHPRPVTDPIQLCQLRCYGKTQRHGDRSIRFVHTKPYHNLDNLRLTVCIGKFTRINYSCIPRFCNHNRQNRKHHRDSRGNGKPNSNLYRVHKRFTSFPKLTGHHENRTPSQGRKR